MRSKEYKDRQNRDYRKKEENSGIYYRRCENSSLPKLIGQNFDDSFRSFAYLNMNGDGLEDAKRAIRNEYLEWKKLNGRK